MQHKTTFFIGLLLLAILLTYFVTYQVGFNEVVVLTTFDKASEESVIHGDSEQAGLLGNLHMKWPPPVQIAHTYDKRVRVLEDRLEEQQTLDKKSIVVSAYVAWRVEEPLDFFRGPRHVVTAEEHIRSRLRDARSVIGSFTFDQLTNTDPEQLKLAAAEQAMRDQLQADLSEQGYGIQIESIGIKRVILPQTVAKEVFNHMSKRREALAQAARSEGDAAAATIKADAESAANRILSFAEARAQAIRAEGAAEAAEHYAVFSQNEDFAIFLRKLEAYSEIFGHNTTFLIDAKEGGLGSEFYYGPGDPGQTPRQQAKDQPAAESAAPVSVTR